MREVSEVERESQARAVIDLKLAQIRICTSASGVRVGDDDRQTLYAECAPLGSWVDGLLSVGWARRPLRELGWS